MQVFKHSASLWAQLALVLFGACLCVHKAAAPCSCIIHCVMFCMQHVAKLKLRYGLKRAHVWDINDFVVSACLTTAKLPPTRSTTGSECC